MGAGGRSSVGLRVLWAAARVEPKAMRAIPSARPTANRALPGRTAEGGCPHMKRTDVLRDMDLHLVDCVVKIAARVPRGGVGLDASLGIRCAREDRVVSRFCLELVTPQPPRVVRLFVAKRCRIPRRAAIG